MKLKYLSCCFCHNFNRKNAVAEISHAPEASKVKMDCIAQHLRY